MSGETNILRRIAWNEVFPWLMILRVFRLATSMPILFLATVGVVLVPLGWLAANQLLTAVDRSSKTLAPYVANNQEWPAQAMGRTMKAPEFGRLPDSWSEFTAPLCEPFFQLTQPFYRLFQRNIEYRSFFYSLAGGVWTLLVWAFLGGAITRIAVVRLGREERESMGDAVRFAGRRFTSYFGAPFFSLAGVVVIAVLASLVGLVMRFDAGVIIASLVWLFVLLGGLLAAILLVGLLFGWPLMWAAISAEEMGDVFEAAQRGYSYTFGRPLHYAFYALVGLLLGSVGFLLVQYFAVLVIELGYWSVAWGAGQQRLQELATSTDVTVRAGNGVIHTLNDLVLTIASAFRFSFFWCAVAAFYLLLRRDIDRTDFDDVYVLDEQQRFGLPPLSTDQAGVPGVAEEDVE